jgi:hypothetical protein
VVNGNAVYIQIRKVAPYSCVNIVFQKYPLRLYSKWKDVPVNFPCADRRILEGCEMSRIPYFLDNQHTGIDEVSALCPHRALPHRDISGTDFG